MTSRRLKILFGLLAAGACVGGIVARRFLDREVGATSALPSWIAATDSGARGPEPEVRGEVPVGGAFNLTSGRGLAGRVGSLDVVVYPSADVAFILGPQLKSGSAANPWPWFDRNAQAKALEHGARYPAKIVSDDRQSLVFDADAAFNRNYYDVAMAMYGEYYRSGNPQVLANARKMADAFEPLLVFNQEKYGGSSPRTLSLGGVMLRALDGRPDYWPFITQTVREQFNGWIYLRKDYPGLYFGLRDSSYMLMYATWLAKVHPDPAVRAEFRAKVVEVSRNYFVRLQRADGGWYWEDDSGKAPGGVFAQPFMVGLLLEAFTYVHQLTGDPVVAASIPRAVDWLQSYYRGTEPVKGLNGVNWRNLPYFAYTDGTWNSAMELPGGWDTNTLREARQANSTVVHAYGYAYQLTKNPKYRQWGDDMFAATYGRGQGPGADAFSNLGDYQEKEFGQAYRSAGRYLVWRADP